MSAPHCLDTDSNPQWGITIDVMSLASNILSVVLALICVASAVADLMMMPQIVESMKTLRVPIRIIPALGVAKLAGAAGLMIGFSNDNLRIYAAFCLTVYFVLATWSHLRVRDTAANTVPAAAIFAIALATLITSL